MEQYKINEHIFNVANIKESLSQKLGQKYDDRNFMISSHISWVTVDHTKEKTSINIPLLEKIDLLHDWQETLVASVFLNNQSKKVIEVSFAKREELIWE